ncbi:MAG: DsbA family protein [Nitrospirae bacterium]|nr:DsbA family protein [Nitrospirota bacterium]MDA1304772.1 DsbA family protein [Nitrospirota bacterium]
MVHRSDKSLLYIADPMCSWCWGFSPVMEAIESTYGDRVSLSLLVGGLRPGNTERFDSHRRDYILGHWHAVHERTSQPFNFEFHMGADFTYDTEPSSRAVVAMRTIQPTQVFSYFRAIQYAFYVENQDVTKEGVLTDLAEDQEIDRGVFEISFKNQELKQQVWDEFDRCRQLEISGFPSLLAMDGETPTALAHGYLPMEELQPKIEQWLAK